MRIQQPQQQQMLQQLCANVFSHVNINKRLHPIPASGNSPWYGAACRDLPRAPGLLAAQQILDIINFIHQ
jgi:hypothetical protein